MSTLIETILKEIDTMEAASKANHDHIKSLASGLRRKLLHFNAGTPRKGIKSKKKNEIAATVVSKLRRNAVVNR